jgi:hypothetical protein
MTLGFDCSTACCGWAFWDGLKIIDAGFIELSKFKSNKDKAFHVISVLDSNPHRAGITKINLEAALSGFMGGRTSQQTIIKLARFNAVFEYIISEQWKLPVNLINVATARKAVLGKARVKGLTGKEYVQQELPKIRPEITRFEKLNTKNKWDEKNGDMYDAVVISCAM